MIDAIQDSAASSVCNAATDAPLWAQPTSLSVSSACLALDIARATFYRNRFAPLFVDPDLDLRDRIQKIALDWPGYGYRRITAQLRRDGVEVNHKPVLRLMRADSLLCLRKARLKIATTDSNHGLPIYPNLAKKLIVTRRDQLWVSDITYVRLGHEFVYLAVVMDAFSRKVIGWALSRRIDSALTAAALDMAIADRKPEPDTVIHHSDRGSQYAGADYVARLKGHKIAVSMSRKGTPQDNAFAESFMKTLKYEEVYMTEYDNIADARDRIGYFLEEVYNKKRLHSALGYLPPVEFETNVSRYKRTAP
jgi:transposase InsO family protein